MTVHHMPGAQPDRALTDSELASSWAAEALAAGRVELGHAVARIAVQAHRLERAGSGARMVPMIGQTRDEAPREPSREALPIHEAAAAAYGHQSGPTGNGDLDLAREAATQIFGAPAETRVDLAVPDTRVCNAQLENGECRGVVYWDHNAAPGTTRWRHTDPAREQDHPAVVFAAEQG